MSDATETDDVVEAEFVDDSATQKGATDVGSAVASLNDASSGYYSTITASTFKERLALAKIINESKNADTVFGEELELQNYIVQVVDINDSNTGEQIEAPRVTFITNKGAFHGTSKGLLTVVRNLNATVGEPSTWEGESVKFKFLEEGVKPRRYTTISFV